ncbi:M6 family metalloprotease domain-containing protein [Halobacillus shinanisalinarum]|uniref:M6 family metalloprotease domain-containing protein n=1 Tax=Halobacillus shinanisalinarum TaxID=2932258 RepID=A0ABY4H450_9BACI|nr:M6 family metalloprotease domain-containing protein [Halobacillus shinanisalinarum]UOQ94685.1 M6 family metalloprotease domain-containing protein [Halobacillus shinanisalinarum]
MRRVKKPFIVFVSFLLVMTMATPALAAKPGLDSFPEPVDSQNWILPEDMTWEDYQPVPGIDWREADVEPDRVLKGALVVVDFPDQEFIISQEKGSGVAGNPVTDGSIPREEVPEFWESFLTEPQPLNNHRSIDEFWRENSYGEWAVEIDAFGTYRMDHNEFEYGMGEFGQEENLPPGYETTYDLREDALEKAQADIEASGKEYDFTFVLHAGYDESGVWQEFGEMMFESPEAVTDEFGPPAEYTDMPNSANTRYVDWTSWLAASSLWSRAGDGISIQGENAGMGTFAHEFGHIMNLGDNYNNPYGEPVSRSYSGPWELMSRGSFNGPGGPHTRWMVMPTLGGSAPAHHMLRNKIKQGFLEEDQYLDISRDELAETGPVFADIITREVPTGEAFGRTGFQGININMVDLTPENSLEDDWRADMQRGEKWYDNYTIEVVDQVGFDSFLPDSGVLMAKTKDEERAPNIWVIDSHEEDIDQVDFVRPDGTKAMYSKGDYRQLADALFKAGTGDGVISEYKDEHNRLHFYVLGKNRDDEDVLSYRVAVRHMDGAGPYERGIDAASGSVDFAVPGQVAAYHFSVTNTGEATDLIRINAETEAGWDVQLQHEVIEVEAGETVDVPVYTKIPKGGQGPKPAPTELTFTSTSETDSSKMATVTRRVGPGKGR